MNIDPGQQPAKPKLDSPTRLAYERTFLAHERTQMGWVRTALALISFGFSIAKFFEYFREQHPEHPPMIEPRTVGIIMILIGLGSLFLSDFQHRAATKAMREQCPGLPPSVAGITAAFIAGLGLLALLAAVIRL